jgi:hypothetical protein
MLLESSSQGDGIKVSEEIVQLLVVCVWHLLGCERSLVRCPGSIMLLVDLAANTVLLDQFHRGLEEVDP